MLGLHLRTTGDERWNEPFDIVRDGENTFTWFHSTIAEHLARAVARPRRTGCHCENTKIWPYCLAGAGLGLQLARPPARHATTTRCSTRWWTRRVPTEVPAPRRRRPPADGDPLLRPDPRRRTTRSRSFVGHDPRDLPRAAGARRARRRLFEAGMTQLGLWEPTGPVSLPGHAQSATALWLAREWGLHRRSRTRSRPRSTSTTSPRGIRRPGEFTWGFELDEDSPARPVQRDDGRGPGRDATTPGGDSPTSAPDLGSPSRRSTASTSPPSRSTAGGGTPSAPSW